MVDSQNLTNPQNLIHIEDLNYFEGKLAAKYQTKSIAVNGITANTVEGALGELKEAIATQISTVYKPAGSIAPAELLPALLVEANVNKVYNLTGDITTDANWIEGAGKTVKAGTDVAIIAVEDGGSTVYKFNALAGHIDLTPYAEKVSGATEGNFAALDANGNLTDSGKKAADFKEKQTAVADPTADGNSLEFIDTISQNANGEISVTKKSVRVASHSDIDEIFA